MTCSKWEAADADQGVAGELLDMVKSEIDRSACPLHPLRLPLAPTSRLVSFGSTQDTNVDTHWTEVSRSQYDSLHHGDEEMIMGHDYVHLPRAGLRAAG